MLLVGGAGGGRELVLLVGLVWGAGCGRELVLVEGEEGGEEKVESTEKS